jgi:hypothetical protein
MVLLSTVVGCGDSEHQGMDMSVHPAMDLSAHAGMDMSSPTSTSAHVVAHVLKGPSAGASGGPSRVGKGPGTRTAKPLATPADGTWVLSPHSVKATITAIQFQGTNASNGTQQIPVSGCSVTFDASAAALTPLLDCAFDIPFGTYTGMNLFLAPTYDVTISDTVNGFFTDPATMGGISNVAPAGGAAPVTITATFGNQFGQFFSSPLVLSSSGPDGGTAPAIYLVLDAVQTLSVTVKSGAPSFGIVQPANGQFALPPPIFVFPTIGGVGRAQYYAQSNTAGDFENDSVVNTAVVRVYWQPGANGQPAYSFIADTSQGIGACFTDQYAFGAFPVAPGDEPPLNDGSRVGGWLASDPSGTLCWALPADKAYMTYAAYISMPSVSTLGSSTTFSCLSTASPTPPSSGSTYAAGCPAITPTATATMYLVAQ